MFARIILAGVVVLVAVMFVVALLATSRIFEVLP